MAENVVPILQGCWKWPALLGSFLSGSASGLFLHLFWNDIVLKNYSIDRTIVLVNSVPVLMAVAGILFFAFEVGLLFHRLGWTRQQLKLWWVKRVLLPGLFLLSSACYAIANTRFSAYGAACAAILLIVFQRVDLSVNHTAAEGASIRTPFLVSSSWIFCGYGFWMLLRIWPRGIPGSLWIVWGAILVLLNLLVWGGYLWLQCPGVSRNNPAMARTELPLMLMLDGGFPLLCLMGIHLSGLAAGAAKAWVIRFGLCCGISICLGGLVKLYVIMNPQRYRGNEE